MSSKVVAIVGSYRKGGVIDTRSKPCWRERGEKALRRATFYLTEQHIEFLHPLPPVCPGAGRGAQQNVRSRTIWSRS